MHWKPQTGCCENRRELEFNTQILNQKKKGPESEKWCQLQGNIGKTKSGNLASDKSILNLFQ